jgi:hypothetical protein
VNNQQNQEHHAEMAQQQLYVVCGLDTAQGRQHADLSEQASLSSSVQLPAMLLLLLFTD